METRQIEAYRYYKGLYPRAAIIFHVGSNYVAILNEERTEVFSDEDIAKLSELGNTFELRIVEYRNEAGEYDFPDINKIKEEKELDT